MRIAEWWIDNRSSHWLSEFVFDVASVALIMALFSVFVGVVIFIIVAVASGSWSATRKWRFARSLSRGLFLPMTTSTVVIPIAVTLCWLFYQRGFPLSPNRWEGLLMQTALLTILLAPLPLIARSMYLSKSPSSKSPTSTERLLPLD